MEYVIWKRKKLLKSTGRQRQVNKEIFKEAQRFDRAYRKTERNYNRKKIIEIEKICASDPRQFWKTIKKLGPKRKQTIPFEACGHDNEKVTYIKVVLDKSKHGFQICIILLILQMNLMKNFTESMLRNWTKWRGVQHVNFYWSWNKCLWNYKGDSKSKVK